MGYQALSDGLEWVGGWRKWLLLLAVALILVGCWQNPLGEPAKLIKVGMLRNDAIRLLSDKSWYHQACPNRVTIDDLFFFGSHKYDKAVVLVVSSEPVNGVFVVYDVASFDEANAWHAAYRDCLQRDRFED